MCFGLVEETCDRRNVQKIDFFGRDRDGIHGRCDERSACSLWELVMIQQQVNGGGIMEATGRMLKQGGTSVLARGSLVCTHFSTLLITRTC